MQTVVLIPSDPLSPSLNLAQSVLLCAYELSQKTYKVDVPALVKHEELENLYKHIHSTLKVLEYIPRGNRDLEIKIMRNLKYLIGRSGLTEWELKMVYGICSQAEKLKGNRALKNTNTGLPKKTISSSPTS